MNYKRFVMFSYIFLTIAGNQPTVKAENYQPSPEEIAAYQQELEAYVSTLQNQFDSWIATLPPEEQQKILEEQRMIDELISNMDEKEFNDLLEEILKEESFLNSVPAEKPVEAVQEEPTVEIKKEVLPTLDLSQYDSIVAVIDFIIKKTDSFLVKVNSIPDIALRVDRWINVKSITTWPTGKLWPQFIGEIEKFCQQLNRLKDRDPQTKAYKYLDALKNNKTVLNSLDELSKVLIENESVITIATFGLEPISKQSRKALKTIIIQYSDFLYKNKSAEELDTIFAQFDPEAEKRRKAAEASRTQAAQPISVPTQPGVVAGQPMTPGQYIPPYSQPYSTPYTQPYTPPSYTQPYIGGQPTTTQPYQNPNPSMPSTGTPNPGAPVSTPPSQQNPVAQTPPATPAAPITDAAADQLLAKVDAQFTAISSLITSNSAFYEVKMNILDATKTVTNSDSFVTQLVPNLSTQITTCLGDIATLASRVKMISPALQKMYTDSLKLSWEKNGVTIRMVLNGLNEITSAQTWNGIPEEKRIAYFKTKDLPVVTMVEPGPGMPPVSQETPAAEGTLFAVKQGIEKLINTISNFPA